MKCSTPPWSLQIGWSSHTGSQSQPRSPPPLIAASSEYGLLIGQLLIWPLTSNAPTSLQKPSLYARETVVLPPYNLSSKIIFHELISVLSPLKYIYNPATPNIWKKHCRPSRGSQRMAILKIMCGNLETVFYWVTYAMSSLIKISSLTLCFMNFILRLFLRYSLR